MQPSQLIQAALAARNNAYAPYSNFLVGAALLCTDGTIYTGCNVENAAYPVCHCAERTALVKAVSEGNCSFTALAVVGGQSGQNSPLKEFVTPCGMCRQALSEFAPDLTVYVATSPTCYREYTLDELLPMSFGPANMNQG